MQIFLWVAVLSLLSAAATMGVIAWRTSRGARNRESARVELLKTLAFPNGVIDPEFSSAISSGPVPPKPDTALAVDAYEATPPVFGERGQPLTTMPRWISLSAVAAAMALGVALYA